MTRTVTLDWRPLFILSNEDGPRIAILEGIGRYMTYKRGDRWIVDRYNAGRQSKDDLWMLFRNGKIIAGPYDTKDAALGASIKFMVQRAYDETS